MLFRKMLFENFAHTFAMLLKKNDLILFFLVLVTQDVTKVYLKSANLNNEQENDVLK